MFIQEMAQSDCLNALADVSFGRLACAHENQPYVIPISFVYEGSGLGGFLYGFTTLGMKVEWMRSNPLVCIELDDVHNMDRWTSIVIFGRYEELPGEPGISEWDQEQRRERDPSQPMACPPPARILPGQQARQHTLELLEKHAEWWDPAVASRTGHNPDQTMTPIFYRIRIDRITGRQATRGPGGQVASRTSALAKDSHAWLQKGIHVLSKLLGSRKVTGDPQARKP